MLTEESRLPAKLCVIAEPLNNLVATAEKLHRPSPTRICHPQVGNYWASTLIP